MTKTTVHVEGHYEIDETPFGRPYKWHPSYVTLKCDCEAELTLSGVSATPGCGRCGTDHSESVNDTQKGGGSLGHEVSPPWDYDTQGQAQQHQQDQGDYPKGSPWRYNDITSDSTNDA